MSPRPFLLPPQPPRRWVPAAAGYASGEIGCRRFVAAPTRSHGGTDPQSRSTSRDAGDSRLRASSGCGTIARLVDIAFRGKIK
jgi:hypothetical protein